MTVIAADMGGVVVPSAIIAVCLVVIVVAIVVRRRRGPDRSAVDRWQKSHGRAVDEWLEAHEGTITDLQEGTDPAIAKKLDRSMNAAAAACPDPVLKRLLLDMQTTALATRRSLAKGDRLSAESAHVAYSNHRQGAIFRIKQLEPGGPEDDQVSDRG